MKNIYQTTLKKPIEFEGVGLHSGKISKLRILPAKANSGVIFKRIDLKDRNLIKAFYKNVTSARLCTTLANEFGTKVSTVEHLLAALYIAKIDNVLVELNTEEVPIMDGSAKNFLDIFKKIELKTFSEKKKFLKILDKIELIDGERKISLEPNNESLEVEFQLNYKNKIIGNQKNKINIDKDDLNKITESRTFCLFEDIEKIKEAGLAKGGSLENAIVVSDVKVLNESGLRNDKEFVNHKILDLVGDFMLSGYRITGKVNCYQGGHHLTNMFLRKLLDSNISEKKIKLKKTVFFEKFNKQSSTKLAVNA